MKIHRSIRLAPASCVLAVVIASWAWPDGAALPANSAKEMKQRALQLLKDGNDGESLAAFEAAAKAPDASPSDRADALYYIGYVHARAKRPAEAVKAYQQVLAAKGASPTLQAKTLLQLSAIYAEQGDKPKAMAYLRRVVDNPQAPKPQRDAADARIAEMAKPSAPQANAQRNAPGEFPAPADGRANAAFSSEFTHGVNYWSVVAPAAGDLMELAGLMDWKPRPGKKGTLVLTPPPGGEARLVGTLPIRVKPGVSYEVEVGARGVGKLSAGVVEGPPERGTSRLRFAGERLDKPRPLGQQFGAWRFAYTPGPGVEEARPCVRLDGERAELAFVAFYVPEADLAASVSWPDSPRNVRSQGSRTLVEQRASAALEMAQGNYDKATGGYAGLSAEQRREMHEAARTPEIVAPYRPIQRLGERHFRLLTSEFTYGGSPLPESVRILGEEVLAGPMRLAVQGKDLPVAAASGALALDASASEVRSSQSSQMGALRMDVSARLLTDALLIVDVCLSAPKPTAVDRLELSIPMRGSVARYFRYAEHSLDQKSERHSENFGPIPKPGEIVNTTFSIWQGTPPNRWNPSGSPASNAVVWSWESGHLPFFWVGDERRGLGWVSETPANWAWEPSQPTFQLCRRSGAVEAKVIFIGKTVAVQKERRVQFILQALPPKPVRPQWFKQKIKSLWAVNKWASGQRTQDLFGRYRALVAAGQPIGRMESPQGADNGAFAWLGWQEWSVGCGGPQVKDPDFLRTAVKAGRAFFGSEALPYLALTHMAAQNPDAQYYGVKTLEWAQLPYRPAGSVIKMCPGSDFVDYMAWQAGKMIDEYDLAGLYFDNCTLRACANEQHGCGVRDADGKLHPSVPFLGAREFFKKIRQQFLKRGKEPFLFGHTGVRPAEVSFMDVTIWGEGVYGPELGPPDITLGEWRAFLIGPNQFGLVHAYYPLLGGTPGDRFFRKPGWNRPENMRHILAYALLHGAPIAYSSANSVNESALWPVWQALNALPADAVDFAPYWEWELSEQLRPQGVLATLYRQPQAALVVVSNLGDEAKVARIPMDGLRKALPRLATVKDALKDGEAKQEEGCVVVEVKAKNFRLLRLE